MQVLLFWETTLLRTIEVCLCRRFVTSADQRCHAGAGDCKLPALPSRFYKGARTLDPTDSLW